MGLLLLALNRNVASTHLLLFLFLLSLNFLLTLNICVLLFTF